MATPFFGIIEGFNFLTTISIILMNLLILNGYSQLIHLAEPNADIELIKQNDPLPSLTTTIFSTPKRFSSVFILRDSTDYMTILTDNSNNNEIITISKSCICSIHDNEYQIFRESGFPFGKKAWKLLVYVILVPLLFWVIFKILGLFLFPTQDWGVFFFVLIISIILALIVIWIFRKKINHYFDKIFALIESL